MEQEIKDKNQGLLIKQRCEDMLEYGYTALRQYPKSEKYTLAAETKNIMYRLLKLIIVCNKKYYKKTTMQELDVELDLLRSFVRLGNTMQFLDFKKYEVWSAKIDEIGRMIGGWFRYIRQI